MENDSKIRKFFNEHRKEESNMKIDEVREAHGIKVTVAVLPKIHNGRCIEICAFKDHCGSRNYNVIEKYFGCCERSRRKDGENVYYKMLDM